MMVRWVKEKSNWNGNWNLSQDQSRTNGKVWPLEMGLTIPLKVHKIYATWSLFVNKCQFWWATLITMDNNNNISTDPYIVHFHMWYFTISLSRSDWLYYNCYISFRNLIPLTTAFWFTLIALEKNGSILVPFVHIWFTYSGVGPFS